MTNKTINTPAFSIFENALIFIQATCGGVEFVSIKGSLSLVCARPKMLLRDILHEVFSDFTPNQLYGKIPFQYEISDTLFKKARNRPEFGDIIPDSACIKDGWILIESVSFAAYHPFHSLQLVWRKNETVFIMFASVNYELHAINTTQAKLVLNSFRNAINRQGLHLSTFAPSSFVSWFPVNRLYAREIKEMSTEPTNFESSDDRIDLRNEVEHAAFKKKLHAHSGPTQRVASIGFD